MLVEETKTLLTDVVTYLPELWAERSDSMVEFTSPTRNDFLTLVEYDLIGLDYLPDILDRIQTLVAGYYLSSVSLLVDIPGIEVRKTLGKLQTRRDPIESILGLGSGVVKHIAATESFEYGLPAFNQTQGGFAKEAFCLEATEDKALRPARGSVGFGKSVERVDELSNLSTGKQLEVVLERDGNRASIPVQIRLAVTDTDSESMKHILAYPADKSFSARAKKVRAGELSAVKDLLFCHDLLTESRKARIRDKSGFYEHMMRRLSKNFLSGLFSLSPSINNASAVIICSAETAKQASLELGGPLSKFSVRQKIFESTATMLLVVIDQQWDAVDIYHRGIDSATTLTARDFKRGGKGGGGNQVSDIITAYQAGSAPSI